MTDYKKIAILLLDGKSRRNIAAECSVSSKTITKVRKYLDENNTKRRDLDKTNNEKLKETISPNKKYTTMKERPDYDTAHIALVEGNSVKSLWNDYIKQCEASNKKGISYTRFFELIKEKEDSFRATEDTTIRAGELCIAKWLNRSVETVDKDGVAGKAYVFMIYFPLSQYVFMYGGEDKTAETTERLISNCFEGIGAVPQKMMTDNTRCFYSNSGAWRAQLKHLCEHYGIRIVPAETISPQVLSEFSALTKKVEKKVRENIYKAIDELEYSLYKMQLMHAVEIIHRSHSRDRLFKDEVLFMRPVPQIKYEPYREEIMEVQCNLHIYIENTYYSVPYTAYMKKRFVTVRVYAGRIEIYQEGNMIAQHNRTSNRYCTMRSHMPPQDMQKSFLWNSARLREWASSIGPETYRVIDGIINGHPIEQQCYVTCITILKMKEKYGMLLETACASVSDNSVLYAYRIISNYLISKRTTI